MPPASRRGATLLLGALLLATTAGLAQAAGVELSGSLLTDWRFTVEGRSRFTFNENVLGVTIKPTLTEDVWLLGSANLVNDNILDKELDVSELQNRSRTEPVRIEIDQAFANFSALGWKHLDVRIGKQRIAWGTADRFNPTDNLNPDNMHDPLDFGKKVPTISLMATAYTGPVSLTGVLLPFFEPAVLPLTDVRAVFNAVWKDMAADFNIASGSAALDNVMAGMMADVLASAELGDLSIRSEMVELTPANMQGAFKIAGSVSVVDLSASYAYVYDDFGVPKTITMGVDDPFDVKTIDVTVKQAYPRLHVIGADFAATLPFLWDIGAWAEAAYFIPEPFTTRYLLDAGATNSILRQLTDQTGDDPLLIGTDEPLDEHFVKATAGLDYTFPGAWYINVQYVRGLPNENTNKAVDNYVFGGLDKPFLYDSIKARLFSGVCFGDGSWILFPQVTFVPYNAVEIILGGLVVFGGLDTKLGAFGDNIAFVKAKVTFK